MKLIGCDRCSAIFPSGTRHTKLRIFDTTDDVIEDDAAPPFESKELCPVCRSDLDAFLRQQPEPVAVSPGNITVNNYQADQAETEHRDGRAGWPERVPDRTCEICGRVGKQRFTETETGWRCSPTAVKCPGNHAQPEPKSPPPGCRNNDPRCSGLCLACARDPERPPLAETEPDAEPIPPSPTPGPPGVTARCKDCTRTWNLTGFILEKAAEMHELKHGHIVEILEPAGAA